jgi:sterol desaturase/sphingolipid hydroxylase (fatty acid hydroxylase superfamily)
MFIIEFLIWTLMLYWVHRISHIKIRFNKLHCSHHQFVALNQPKWHWSNIFFYMDNPKSAIDVWITEVIPTIIFCWIINSWWLIIFYWIWAAFLQERYEHKTNLDLILFTSGKWHMIHHCNPKRNFGLFIPLWDIVFGTYEPVPKTQ